MYQVHLFHKMAGIVGVELYIQQPFIGNKNQLVFFLTQVTSLPNGKFQSTYLGLLNLLDMYT